ncbi:hypothetical protein GCM10020000_58200 [Streptomyces olivoverticillatus]
MTQDLAHSVRPSAEARAQAEGWWRSAVIYQVYVRSFADSDGDGIGDLRGIRERLPYLAELGVDALWLTPFYASPQADGGYDVADYRAVDPLFGQLSDADDLVREAHRLGLRVIVDIVPNHTSDQHVWFRAALAGEPEGAARARYHFRPGRGRAASCRPTTGSPSSAARRGRAPPARTAPRASGTCTCSPPSSRTSTGTTPRCGPSSSRCCGSGWTWGWTASASTWRTAWSRRPGCRTSAVLNRPN